MAAAAIDRADRRLEAEAAAETRWPQDRPEHLRADPDADRADSDRGRGAAARAAGRAGQVPRIARGARLHPGEFGRHRLAEDQCARVAQSRDAGGVAVPLKAREQRRTILGRHIDGLDDVLDPNRHAVDRRKRLSRPPALRGAIRRRPRAGEIERDEGADLRLPGVEFGDAALEELRAANLFHLRNSPSRGETAASGASSRRARSFVRFRCFALRPILASPGVGIARSNEAVIASEAKRSRGRTARYVPWIASSLTLLATPIAVLLLALFIPHSEGRAKRGVSKNGSVGACAGRPSRRAFGAPQDEVGG